MSNATLCTVSVTGPFCVLVSLDQISQTRQHIKVTHPGNSDYHGNNRTEATKLKTIRSMLRGRAGQWLWSWEETVSRKKTSTLTPRYVLFIVHPVPPSDISTHTSYR